MHVKADWSGGRRSARPCMSMGTALVVGGRCGYVRQGGSTRWQEVGQAVFVKED